MDAELEKDLRDIAEYARKPLDQSPELTYPLKLSVIASWVENAIKNAQNRAVRTEQRCRYRQPQATPVPSWDKPYLLDTQEKVDWANYYVPSTTAWRIGDHCHHRPADMKGTGP